MLWVIPWKLGGAFEWVKYSFWQLTFPSSIPCVGWLREIGFAVSLLLVPRRASRVRFSSIAGLLFGAEPSAARAFRWICDEFDRLLKQKTKTRPELHCYQHFSLLWRCHFIPGSSTWCWACLSCFCCYRKSALPFLSIATWVLVSDHPSGCCLEQTLGNFYLFTPLW